MRTTIILTMLFISGCSMVSKEDLDQWKKDFDAGLMTPDEISKRLEDVSNNIIVKNVMNGVGRTIKNAVSGNIMSSINDIVTTIDTTTAEIKNLKEITIPGMKQSLDKKISETEETIIKAAPEPSEDIFNIGDIATGGGVGATLLLIWRMMSQTKQQMNNLHNTIKNGNNKG